MEQNNYREETNKWLKRINIEGSVIDIGGGKRTAKERLGNCDGEYAILDRKQYKGLEFNPDIEHDMNYPLKTDMKFDHAFALFVIEFFWNPVQAFHNIRKLLKDNGKLYFNAPYKMPHLVEEDYYRFTDNGIKKLLEETGFDLSKISFQEGEYSYYLVEANARKI